MIDLSVFHIFTNFFNFELKIARLLTLAVTQHWMFKVNSERVAQIYQQISLSFTM